MKYDPFQQKALTAIDAEKSVLVSAPTGAGKTAIAEYAIVKALARRQRVVYTAPIKALSNQKYRDFSLLYPDQVGLLTGDVTLNPDAPLLIMTTEIYRNQLFEDPARLSNTFWVIFDEVHYLDDPERGTVWEEAMMFSPEHVRFIALSATAPNIEELAEWIRRVLGHPLEVILEKNRPVPLRHYFQCQGRIFKDTIALKKEGYLHREVWPSGHRFFDQGRKRRSFGRGHPPFPSAKPNRTDELVRYLSQNGQLPCLYFSFGRRRTEELAWEMLRFDFLSQDEKERVAALYRDLCGRFDLLNEPSALDMRRLVERGIAFHHAGMLPTLKEVIERLFTSRLIKLIFTTETFALGINMPAKSVAFDEMRKFDGQRFGFLSTRDYFQMAGRAGRRGIDAEGYVYSKVNPHDLPLPVLLRIVYGRPEPIESQFNSCYATLLNLYATHGDKLLEFYPKSFHYFQSGKKDRQRSVSLLERKIELLKVLGHIGNNALTSKGSFACWMYGYELVLSEMLENGSLETLNETKLAVLLCALVYEPRRKDADEALPSHLKEVEKKALGPLKIIASKEAAFQVFPKTKRPCFNLARATEAWVQGCYFSDLGRYSDVDEGELIRYFRMVIQLLRQLKNAPLVSDRLKKTASGAMQKINRGLVDAEKQLRVMDEPREDLAEVLPSAPFALLPKPPGSSEETPGDGSAAALEEGPIGELPDAPTDSRP